MNNSRMWRNGLFKDEENEIELSLDSEDEIEQDGERTLKLDVHLDEVKKCY